MKLPIILAQLLFLSEQKDYINETLKWSFIENKHWVATKIEGSTPEGSKNCPSGDMIEIKGLMSLDPSSTPYSYDTIENLQNKTCLKWVEKNPMKSCIEFDRSKWEKIRENLPKKEMHFCIDPYEWPNRDGAAPWIMVTWEESKMLCESIGKRLCSEEEWTFACEGEDVLPLPNGYIRDSQKCNIDKSWKTYNDKLLFPRGTLKSGKELERLWQGYPSGSNPDCVSPFGVHDMVGNVEELTTASMPSKHQSILKGGYWSDVKAQCRHSIRSHGTWHTFYQQGFRCCGDPQ